MATILSFVRARDDSFDDEAMRVMGEPLTPSARCLPTSATVTARLLQKGSLAWR